MKIRKSANRAQLDSTDLRSKAISLNRYFFLTGIAGAPICIWGDSQWHAFPWLIGLGVSVYFIVSSVTDAVMRTREDVRAWKEANVASGTSTLGPIVATQPPPPVAPLRTSPYFRAGIMGLPFCICGWFFKHTPVFLLGGGFFAGLLMATLFHHWSRKQVRSAAVAPRPN